MGRTGILQCLIVLAVLAAVPGGFARPAARAVLPRLDPDPDDTRVLASPDTLRRIDATLRAAAAGAVEDPSTFPEELDGKTLSARLQAWDLESRIPWRDGRRVSADQIEALKANRAVDAVRDRNPVVRAVAIRVADLRMWPSADGLFEQPDDRVFDLLQATTVGPGEPLVLLHRSRDGAWWLARAALSDGWIRAAEVAVVGPADWGARVAAPADFVVVTDTDVRVPDPAGGPPRLLPMGTRLARSGRGRMLLPVRRPDGTARFVPVPIPRGGRTSRGYLPWTRATVRDLALRHLGHPYGWGGAGGRVDCSSLVVEVYRCVGLHLPRNSGVQAQVPARLVDLGPVPPDSREAALASLPAGSLLNLPGHVMLLLGHHEGRAVVLHALAARGRRDDATGQVQRVPVFEVVTGDLSLLRTSGLTLRDSLVSASILETLAAVATD